MTRVIFRQEGTSWKFVCEQEGSDETALDKAQRSFNDGDRLLVVCTDIVCPSAKEYTVGKTLTFTEVVV